jgi:hypothetical protein
MLTGHRSSSKKSAGQALVEFALVLPVFLVIFFGTIDGGRLVYTLNQLSQAAREGARVAAVEASWVGPTTMDPSCVTSEAQITSGNPGAHVCPLNAAALKADVVRGVTRMSVGLNITVADVFLACDSGTAGDMAPTGDWTELTVKFPSCGGAGVPNGAGDEVSVRVVYEFIPITPMAGSMIGRVTLSGSTTMAISAGKAIP